MTGCRHNAKNTLVKNYLYLAERAGAIVHPETMAVTVRPSGPAGYTVDTVRTGAWRASRTARTFTAGQVVFAAGTWGTQQLLHRMKARGMLPEISARLGVLTRTNSEALGGAQTTMRNRKKHDFTRGVAITSAIHPDERTQIEPVRYGLGSNAMGLLSTLMTDGGGRLPRGVKWLAQVARHPGQFASLYEASTTGPNGRDRAHHAGPGQLDHRQAQAYPARPDQADLGAGARRPNPDWIPAANEAMRRIAAKIGGFPLSSAGEMVNIPMTAHFLGGCVIGDGADSGVVDAYHRVYGHPGLHVVDGSAISANLGVNPALTITAQAERAMALWPNRGEADPRPALAPPTGVWSPSSRGTRPYRRPRPRRCGGPSPRTVRPPGDRVLIPARAGRSASYDDIGAAFCGCRIRAPRPAGHPRHARPARGARRHGGPQRAGPGRDAGDWQDTRACPARHPG